MAENDAQGLCGACAAVSSSALCGMCVRKLWSMLDGCRDLARDLETAITRQSKTGAPQPGGGNGETPLAFDETASNALRALTLTLQIYGAQRCLQRREHAIEDAVRIAEYDDAATAYSDISRDIGTCNRAIDRRVRIYLGQCSLCGRELFQTDDADTVECSCGGTYSVPQRRHENLCRSGDLMVTDHQAVEYLGEVFGIRIRVTRIRNWGARQQVPRTPDPVSGKHMYRMKDILNMIRDTPSLATELGDSATW